MALDEVEAKKAQKMGKQNGPLLNREGHADAYPRARAERDIGETVDAVALFAEESGRIEGVGIIPEPAAPVQDIGRDQDDGSRRHALAKNCVVPDRLAAEKRDRRIETQSLV